MIPYKKLPLIKLSYQGKTLADHCFHAITFFSRLKGLIGTKSIRSNEAILFSDCKMVHSFFMSIPIDVIFLDDENKEEALVRAFDSLLLPTIKKELKKTLKKQQN